jgi:alpha-galactosidase
VWQTQSMSNSPRIVFLGAGSVEFTQELLCDILALEEFKNCQIVLHDINQERLETSVLIANAVSKQLGASPVITSHLVRREALVGADYVINSIAVGALASTITDFEIPAKYGLNQTIGDTLGIGGIFRALRTFPVLKGIAEDMAAVCPDAWFLNYTNPMAMNITYLSRIAPKLKTVGLCHSVYWTAKSLSDLVGVPFDEVTYESAGVNHQAWLLKWEHQGKSLYPLLDEKIASDPELRRRVRVDMYRRLGVYPTETSEHSSEYVPWYLRHASEIDRLRIQVGGYVEISKDNVLRYQRTRDELLKGLPIDISRDTSEYAPQVIHSLETGLERNIIVNIPNQGHITNLPDGYTIEVPATVDKEGLHPKTMGALPTHLAALNQSFINVGELVVQAAVSNDPHKIRMAAMLDPNTASSLTVDQIWDMCNELVKAHGDLLQESLRKPLTI